MRNVSLQSGFSWQQCGSAKDPIRLQAMNVTPSIFPSKGNVTLVDFRASTSIFLASPIKVLPILPFPHIGQYMKPIEDTIFVDISP